LKLQTREREYYKVATEQSMALAGQNAEKRIESRDVMRQKATA